METISKWGPWMDIVSIYIIPIGATIGAVSWFYVMKKDELLEAVNCGSKKNRGTLWYSIGRYHLLSCYVQLHCLNIYRFKKKQNGGEFPRLFFWLDLGLSTSP